MARSRRVLVHFVSSRCGLLVAMGERCTCMTIEATRLRQQPGVESFFLPDGSCLLFDPASDEGYALNIAGALVWDYCDGELTGAEVAGELASLLPQYGDMQEAAERPQATPHGVSARAPTGSRARVCEQRKRRGPFTPRPEGRGPLAPEW